MSYVSQNIYLASGDTLPVSVTQSNTYSIHDLDITHLISWINNNYVFPRWRIYVLFSDESINYEIPADDIQTGGSFSENYQDGQRRSLSFSL